MRSEQEMMELIRQTAQKDERIRAAVLNGSRANPNAPKDCFQDYDVVYIVRDLNSFIGDHSYPRVFGEPLMVQMPEIMRDPMGDGRFTYLTLYQDGVRVDLQLLPVENWKPLLGNDSQTILILDKDGILPVYEPASDKDYYLTPPDELSFYSCCNNFWWCMQNVAKGIWRQELPYAMGMYHLYVREELDCMVRWYIASQHGVALSAGKMGKYFKKYLSPQQYAAYEKTYSDGQAHSFWNSLFTMCDLFRTLGHAVAHAFCFVYREEEDKAMTAYLHRVRALPSDATEL